VIESGDLVSRPIFASIGLEGFRSRLRLQRIPVSVTRRLPLRPWVWIPQRYG